MNWILVKTIKVTTNPPVTYHIHLFESDTGARRAEFLCDGESYNINRPDGWLKKTDLYQLEIYRWLKGRYDPNIPRYSECPLDDTANALRGQL